MSNINNKDILSKDWPKLKITKEMRDDVKKHPERYLRCPARIRMGKFYTDEEFEKRSNEILNTPLPGAKKSKCKRLTKKLKKI